MILVGERLAAVPGALSAAAWLAGGTGARLAWVPRRAGERGAVEAGALPGLLPGGRAVGNAAARAQVEAVWGPIPDGVGSDTAGILASNSLGALVIGGVRPGNASSRLATTTARL